MLGQAQVSRGWDVGAVSTAPARLAASEKRGRSCERGVWDRVNAETQCDKRIGCERLSDRRGVPRATATKLQPPPKQPPLTATPHSLRYTTRDTSRSMSSFLLVECLHLLPDSHRCVGARGREDDVHASAMRALSQGPLQIEATVLSPLHVLIHLVRDTKLLCGECYRQRRDAQIHVSIRVVH